MRILTTLLIVAAASNASELLAPLSLGTLSLASLHTNANFAPGLLVVSIATGTRMSAARNALAGAIIGCGTIEAALPPRAFLVHARTAACAVAAAAVGEATAPLPPALRSPPLHSTLPLRVVRLDFAPNADLHEKLSALLLDTQCAMISLSPRSAVISALTLCANTACALDSLAGICDECVVPADLVSAVVSLDNVLWLERVVPTTGNNAPSRAITQTMDLVNNPHIAEEYGTCNGGSTTCNLIDDLPFSLLNDLYNLSATAGSQLRSRPTGPKTSSKGSQSLTALRSRPTGRKTPSKGKRSEIGSTSQDTCTTVCTEPSCGLGFASCAGLDSPLAYVGLNGSGQIVNVVDSGLDYFSPFFYDPEVSVTPTNQPPFVLSDHRKVAAYWSYMDSIDMVAGHGTHVSGSVAGNVALFANQSDALIFKAVAGLAPDARIMLTDVGCNTEGGCVPPASIPTSCSPLCPADGYFYTPLELSALFKPAYDAGARISSNSWGGGTSSSYSTTAADLDDYITTQPDHLLLFSAGNDGKKGYSTLSFQAVAKNVLTVGASSDGLLSHLLNIKGVNNTDGSALPPLFGLNGPDACGAKLNKATIDGLYPDLDIPYMCGDIFYYTFSSYSYTFKESFDLALCYSCSAKAIFDDLFNNPAVEITETDFLSYLLDYENTYNARLATDFSSRGPTLDGRIKPDITAPGSDIVSARASNHSTYNVFQCGTGILKTDNSYDQALFTFTGAGVHNYFAAAPISFTEALELQAIEIFIDSVSQVGQIYLAIVDSNDMYIVAPIVSDVALGFTGNIQFSIGMTFGSGTSGIIVVMASEGLNFNMFATLSQAPLTSRCFGTLGTTIAIPDVYGPRLNLAFARGGAAAWIIQDSGTSMATPIVAGNAALVRSYFTDGFYPSGIRGGSTGFSPSAALMKATLINAAIPLIYSDIEPMPVAEVRAKGGFGIPQLTSGLSFTSLGSATRTSGALVTMLLPGLSAMGQDPNVTDGEANVYCIDTVTPSSLNSALPFSATLVWTDPAASPIALYALVNDLDLEVTLPGENTIIYGNNDPSDIIQHRDERNNVEKLSFSRPSFTLSATGVRLKPPFRVVVRGSNLLSGGNQYYALVVTGAGVVKSTVSCGGDPFESSTPSMTPSQSITPTNSPTPSMSPSQAATMTQTILPTSIFLSSSESTMPLVVTVGVLSGVIAVILGAVLWSWILARKALDTSVSVANPVANPVYATHYGTADNYY